MTSIQHNNEKLNQTWHQKPIIVEISGHMHPTYIVFN